MDDIIYGFLKIFTDYDSISITEAAKLLKVNYIEIISEISYIFEKGYICKLSNEHSSPSISTSNGDLPINTQLMITTEGRIAYKNYKKKIKKDNIQNIRDWVTLIVAIVTLIATVVGIILNIFL